MITRHPNNPVLEPSQVPYPADCVFNAGAAKINGDYLMVFRNDFDYRGGAAFGGCCLGLARSSDGVDWTVDPEPIVTIEQARQWFADSHHPRFGADEISRVYDPRITVLDDQIHLTVAMDTRHGILGAILRTDDFRRFELISLSVPDNRNMVLFPERIGDRYYRLERPFSIYGRGAPEAFDLWSSSSPDLTHWGNSRLVLGSEEVPYANSKIGPAAPPIRTPAGWLAAIHAVHKDDDQLLNAWGDQQWTKAYHAGLALLDLDDPQRLIGISRQPLLTPEPPYETDGFRGSVIFPCAMIAEDSGEVKIYYGAADTVVALASADLDDLLSSIEPVPTAR
ncbi:glycoside hydrolase family 130 protein [Microlunatus soli]|uniref:Beta-1,4-mannooligosaccharide/beta-1,4-mannosyl-N-acetylglucosamine phosphorylase n=1 Tax=Microlunatus soli TaxID=630515 RepID=A0A1H1NE34_9ACTN|nr:glycoside hydrolase family 130 protein [Microlunatus soli]SDR97174.1 beta-1,4-mannooligosaccharide/beta-1,4-mannosyl-N-acetylglucosamine phosphorylase [Microlunatus soli]